MARRKKVEAPEGFKIDINFKGLTHTIEHSVAVPTFMITAEVGRALERLVRESSVEEIAESLDDGNDNVSSGNRGTSAVVDSADREDKAGQEVAEKSEGTEENGTSESDSK